MGALDSFYFFFVMAWLLASRACDVSILCKQRVRIIKLLCTNFSGNGQKPLGIPVGTAPFQGFDRFV